MSEAEWDRLIDQLWNEAPVSLDLLTADGILLRVNNTQSQLLGYDAGELEGKSWESIYTKPCREFLSGLFDEHTVVPAVKSVQLRHRNRQLIEMAGQFQFVDHREFGRCLCIAKTAPVPAQQYITALEQDVDILRDTIQRSGVPSWCIEYPEPVDLSAPDDVIIRQVFENKRHWRHCNEAMGKLYRLPPGSDLNQRSVDDIFHRNEANEEFVRTLIKHEFNVDGVASYDTRYDGTEFYVENDVRAKIHNGFLLRMWGTVRDLSKHHRREKLLLNRKNEVEDILKGIVDPLLVISDAGIITNINPAVEQRFGWSGERIIGENIQQFFRSGEAGNRLLEALKAGRPVNHIPIDVTCRDGNVISTEASAGGYQSNGGANYVVVLRLALNARH